MENTIVYYHSWFSNYMNVYYNEIEVQYKDNKETHKEDLERRYRPLVIKNKKITPNGLVINNIGHGLYRLLAMTVTPIYSKEI